MTQITIIHIDTLASENYRYKEGKVACGEVV